MSLIKISDKHSNLRLRFEHPIALNPEKKYILGVGHLLFSFEKGYKINLFFDYFIPVPDTNIVVTAKGDIYVNYTIASLKKKFQRKFHDGFNMLIEQNKKEKNLIFIKN